jgi:hypothetical protein
MLNFGIYSSILFLLYDLEVVLLGFYPKQIKILFTQNLPMYVYSNIIHNYQNLEATKKSFCK